MRRVIVLAAVAVWLAVGATATEAQVRRPSLQTSFGCTVSATSVNFGQYDPLSSVPDETQGSISYSCDVTKYRVTIEISSGNNGRFDREMRGADALKYNLFLDANCRTVWGDGSHGTQKLVDYYPNRDHRYTVAVYGRIPARQDVRAGSYSDRLVVTMQW